MRIVILSHYFSPHVGGIEILVYNQAKELSKRGHDVIVISSKLGNEPEEEIIEGFRVKRLKVWNIFERQFGIPYPVFWPDSLIKMNKEIKESDIIYIHDSFYLSSFFGSILARIYHKPIVLMQHIKKVNDRRRIVNIIQDFVHLTYSKSILNHAKKIVVCNKEVGKWANQNRKTLFFENCVNTKLFNLTTKERKIKLRKKYELPLNKPIVLFVGRLVEKKGFQKLFEARDNDYLILFVGDGKVPENMRDIKDTKFISAQPQNRLSELYQLSDVFCLPSINEGFPLTILEAMACGLPIITSDHFGYRDYLNEKFVNLINPEVEEIKKSIVGLLDNTKKLNEMGKWSRNEVEKRFDWKINVNKLENVFRKVIKQNETTKSKQRKKAQ